MFCLWRFDRATWCKFETAVVRDYKCAVRMEKGETYSFRSLSCVSNIQEEADPTEKIRWMCGGTVNSDLTLQLTLHHPHDHMTASQTHVL